MEKLSVTDLAMEMRRAVARIAGPRGWQDTRESWLQRASRRADVPYRTVKSLFYGEIRDPKFSIVEKIRKAEARRVREELAASLENVERSTRGLNEIDPEFYGPHVLALRQQVDDLRHLLDSTRDQEGMTNGQTKRKTQPLTRTPCRQRFRRKRQSQLDN